MILCFDVCARFVKEERSDRSHLLSDQSFSSFILFPSSGKSAKEMKEQDCVINVFDDLSFQMRFIRFVLRRAVLDIDD